MTCPFIQRAGPARCATTSAMSSGVPSRSSGGIEARWSIVAWSLPSRKSGVAVGPGATALTVMSRPRSSRARMSVIASTPPLVAAYHAVEHIELELGERREQHDPGGVHDDVDAAVHLLGRVEHCGDVGFFGDVGLDRTGGSPGGDDCVDGRIGRRLAT